MDDKIEIMLVDDHSLVRDGIRSLLEDEEAFYVSTEASDGREAISLLSDHVPDVMIVDIRMPKMTGIELVSQISKMDSVTRYLMLSMHDSEEYVMQSIQAGAHGYLLKDASKEEFLKAVHTVHAGEMYFSGDVSKYLVKNYVNQSSESPSIEAKKEVKKENPAGLTRRELQILSLALAGKSNQEIADELEKSKRTVEVHRFNLMKKIGAKNLAELILMSREMGYLM